MLSVTNHILALIFKILKTEENKARVLADRIARPLNWAVIRIHLIIFAYQPIVRMG